MKFRTILAVALCALFATSGFGGERAVRQFVLKYQDTDFAVPQGEEWKLSWKSPYKAGVIVPAYDVRIKGDGAVSIGEKRSVQAAAFSTRDDGLLDISASVKGAVIWLSPGTKFETANDTLRIHVTVYKPGN